MDENLIGYLLKALDADEQRDVEDYLRQHPEAQKRLEQLRRRLDLLALDAGDDEPPAGLWVGALARVAEHKCRTLPAAPAAAGPALAPRMTWWRRADVLVAAVLLVLVGGLGAAWLVRSHQAYHKVERANNLRQFDRALEAYADNHNGQYPWVGAEPPKNFAGSFVPALNEAGAMPSGLSVDCPGDPPRPPSALTFADLERMYRENPDEFSTIRALAGGYAYSLGYRDPGGFGLLGLTRSSDDGLPIMADAPPGDGNDVRPGNSPNHGGTGQNVLYKGGNVRFVTTSAIYCNGEGRVAAGRSAQDAPVGRSDARPYPE